MKEYFISITDVVKLVHSDGPIGIDPQIICPHYSSCRTAQSAGLSYDFCKMYKCATFYHLRKTDNVRESSTKMDIARVVQQHFQNPSGNGNGNSNGHSNGNGYHANGNGNGNSNGRSKRVSPIAASFY